MERATGSFEDWDRGPSFVDLNTTTGNPLLRLQGSACAATSAECCLALEFNQQQESMNLSNMKYYSNIL